MYHKLIVVGNVGSNGAELRHTPDGTVVASFSVASNRAWNRPDGSKGKETVWFKVTAWQRLAEICHEYLVKGQQVLVEGRLKPDENGNPHVWIGNDGIARASFELTAETVRFLSKRKNDHTGDEYARFF